MVRRSTWILLVILVILAGFTWVFQCYQVKKTDNTATVTPTIALVNIYDLTGKQVNQVDLSDSSGTKVVFNRNSDSGKWSITNTPLEQADSFQIESNFAQLFAITAQETLTQTPPLDSIGLVSPAYTIHMTTTDGGIMNTDVGSITPIGNGYYLQVNSGPIIIVDKVVMDDVLNMITNPPLIATPTSVITITETVSPFNSGALKTPTP
jgi:Domain of unknown function (DUF4340)